MRQTLATAMSHAIQTTLYSELTNQATKASVSFHIFNDKLKLIHADPENCCRDIAVVNLPRSTLTISAKLFSGTVPMISTIADTWETTEV
jgi:hypothetical protein